MNNPIFIKELNENTGEFHTIQLFEDNSSSREITRKSMGLTHLAFNKFKDNYNRSWIFRNGHYELVQKPSNIPKIETPKVEPKPLVVKTQSGDVTIGTKIYYTGDQSNNSGWGEVTEIIKPDGKFEANPTIHVTMNKDYITSNHVWRLKDYDFSKGAGARFLTKEEYDAKRTKDIETLNKSIEKLKEPKIPANILSFKDTFKKIHEPKEELKASKTQEKEENAKLNFDVEKDDNFNKYTIFGDNWALVLNKGAFDTIRFYNDTNNIGKNAKFVTENSYQFSNLKTNRDWLGTILNKLKEVNVKDSKGVKDIIQDISKKAREEGDNVSEEGEWERKGVDSSLQDLNREKGKEIKDFINSFENSPIAISLRGGGIQIMNKSDSNKDYYGYGYIKLNKFKKLKKLQKSLSTAKTYDDFTKILHDDGIKVVSHYHDAWR